MAAMVIVNNPGDWSSVYPPLLHAAWHGWTPTDLVFPFFLLIVGVSITLSSKSDRVGAIVRRALILVLIGVLLSAFPHFDWDRLRLPGVLQRIGICYLLAALIFRSLGGTLGGRRTALGVAIVAAALVTVHGAVLMLAPGEGGVVGDLSPEGNIGAVIDRALLEGHLWRPRWDPEGLFSTIPAVGTTLLGILIGLWMRTSMAPARRVLGLVAAGLAGVAVGTLWHAWLPINKNLWTGSYVIFTAGAGALLLAACYWLVDVQGWRAWARPFVILGANALALFVLSGAIGRLLIVIPAQLADGSRHPLGYVIYANWFEPLASPKNASLLFALTHLVLLFGVLWWMYRQRIFWRA